MNNWKRYPGFIVVNVGCIECGVPSNIVGLYATEEEAEAVAKVCGEKLSWRHGGQNSFEVFDLSVAQDKEYSEALTCSSPA